MIDNYTVTLRNNSVIRFDNRKEMNLFLERNLDNCKRIETPQLDAGGYIPDRDAAWTSPLGGLPTTIRELDQMREAIRDLPDGLKAVIYRDLHREDLRISDAEKKAEKYEWELRKGNAS